MKRDAEALGADPPTGRMSIAVIVATTGRPRTSRQTIERLARQTRPVDRIVVVAVTPADIAELDQVGIAVESYFAPRGLPHQRNRGLDIVRETSDLVIFLDDDFLLSDDYVEIAEVLFTKEADIVGATGRVVADGIHGPGITFEEAEAILEADARVPAGSPETRPLRALYGCNMVFRGSAIGDLRFDENLPLYAWQEDIDFSYQVGAGGRNVRYTGMSGVHMGEKAGRTSGLRLGYSQIANPIYLLGKKTIPPDLAWRNMRRNLASNIWRSLRPEPYIDRRGRLLGNLIAMRDLVVGRMDPRRILDMGQSSKGSAR